MKPWIAARPASPVVIHTVGYQRETAVDAASAADNATGHAPGRRGRIGGPPPPPARAGAARVQFVRPTGVQHCAPAVIQRKVCVTCMKPVVQQETIEYPVTHFQPKPRSETVSFYEYQTEKVAREEEYTVEVPQQRVRTREVTVMQTVAEQQPQAVYGVGLLRGADPGSGSGASLGSSACGAKLRNCDGACYRARLSAVDGGERGNALADAPRAGRARLATTMTHD